MTFKCSQITYNTRCLPYIIQFIHLYICLMVFYFESIFSVCHFFSALYTEFSIFVYIELPNDSSKTARFQMSIHFAYGWKSCHNFDLHTDQSISNHWCCCFRIFVCVFFSIDEYLTLPPNDIFSVLFCAAWNEQCWSLNTEQWTPNTEHTKCKRIEMSFSFKASSI